MVGTAVAHLMMTPKCEWRKRMLLARHKTCPVKYGCKIMRGKVVAAASVLMAIALLWGSFSFAAQALLTDDAHTDSTRPNSNYGNTATLLINNATAFIKFDLSTLPAGVVGADVEKATLILFVASVKTAGS